MPGLGVPFLLIYTLDYQQGHASRNTDKAMWTTKRTGMGKSTGLK